MQELLIIIGCGVLGYEIATSELSFFIKRIVGMHKPQKAIELLKTLDVYIKVLGFKITSILFPLVFLVMALANAYGLLYKLLNCPYCSAFQLTFWLSLLVFNIPLVTCLLMAGCSLLVTGLYNLIRIHSI